MSTLNDLLPQEALHVGLGCMIVQLVGMFLFAYVLPKGPWSSSPGSTAHQVVALPMMIFLAIRGFQVWLGEQQEMYEQGTDGRIFTVSPGGLEIGSIVWGMMILWDIPISFMVPALQDTVMLVHHVSLVFVSGTSIGVFSKGNPVGTYYAAFFFGVTECSSIFLAVVDIFHPKNAAWHKWLNESQSAIGGFCRGLNEIMRPLFAVAFILLRCIWFPYVMVSTCLMDWWSAAMLPPDQQKGASQTLFLAVFAFCLLFTVMQLYWGKLVMVQILKALGVFPGKKSEKTS